LAADEEKHLNHHHFSPDMDIQHETSFGFLVVVVLCFFCFSLLRLQAKANNFGCPLAPYFTVHELAPLLPKKTLSFPFFVSFLFWPLFLPLSRSQLLRPCFRLLAADFQLSVVTSDPVLMI
jgi:hypothetical protein